MHVHHFLLSHYFHCVQMCCSLQDTLLSTFFLLGNSATDRLTTEFVKQGYGNLLGSVLQTCLQRAIRSKVYFNISRHSFGASSATSSSQRRKLSQSTDDITTGVPNRAFNGYLPWKDLNSSYNLIDTQGRVNSRSLDPGHRNTVLGGVLYDHPAMQIQYQISFFYTHE